MAFNWEPFGRTRHDDPPPQRRREGGASPSKRPARRIAVLTCMDCRIDPLRALGLELGDAVVLRNAGAQFTDDVARSLRLARGLGIEGVEVVGHTDCAAYEGDDEAAAAGAARAAARLRATIPELRASAVILDLTTGKVSRPDAAPPPSG
jgi:carbonic anhydrase